VRATRQRRLPAAAQLLARLLPHGMPFAAHAQNRPFSVFAPAHAVFPLPRHGELFFKCWWCVRRRWEIGVKCNVPCPFQFCRQHARPRRCRALQAENARVRRQRWVEGGSRWVRHRLW